nr:MAG TPA: minor tail protein [Caudoviricetes sp.]
MAADGTIIVQTDLDNAKLSKDLEKVKNQINKLEKSLENMGGQKSQLTEQFEKLSVTLDEAKAKLYEMQNAAKGTYGKEQISEQRERVRGLQTEYNRVATQVETLEANMGKASEELAEAKDHAGGLERQLAETPSAGARMRDVMAEADKRLGKIANRMKLLARRVLVFSVLLSALRKVRDWMGEVVKSNSEASASLARLKGALLTLAQPLVNVIIPAFTAFVNVLTKVVSVLAAVVSSLFGTTAKQSAEAAKNLYNEQKALKATGSAAKKAAGQLASFDEINKLTSNDSGGGSSSGISPDFSALEKGIDLTGKIGEITAFVSASLLALGAILTFSGANIPLGLGLMAAGAVGLAAVAKENWDYISSQLMAHMNDILGDIMAGGGILAVIGLVLLFTGHVGIGLALFLAGAAAFATAASFQWGGIEQDIKTVIGKITLVLGGALLVLGAVLTFTGVNLPLGIALMAAGAAGLITSAVLNWDKITGTLKPVISKIMTAVGGSLLVLGAIFAFSGINIPLGIAMLLAGGASLISVGALNWNAILDKFKEIWKGIKNWWNTDVAEFFTAEYWKNVMKKIGTGIVSVFYGAVNVVIRGINWLISKLNTISFAVPEWVPLIGGKKFGFNISKVKEIAIPRLAAGAVIPPNREFMAVLGDQKSGRNLEAPESLIRQIVREESGGGSGDVSGILYAILEAIREGKVLSCDDKTLAAVVGRAQARQMRAKGGGSLVDVY